ncbi:MAG: adenylate/guanylate cyclase domain-containing protein, partial [Phycisphaeraceae bacterium]|nr:adenylate/guanylate cyclase domain-containing protein [Phycisphaeraceae bacterium]
MSDLPPGLNPADVPSLPAEADPEELERLRTENERLLSSMAEASVAGISALAIRIDADDIVVYVNTAMAEYFDHSRDQLVGESASKLRAMVDENVAAALHGPETENRVPDGDVVRDRGGRVFRVRTTVHDQMADIVLEDVTDEQRFRDYVRRYVSMDLADFREEDLSTFRFPERRFMSVTFTDLRGFTDLSERLDPERVRSTLNAYLEAMTNPVDQNRATVDKFVGDQVMSLFGAPRYHRDHALRAVKTACEQMTNVQRLREDLESFGEEGLTCGIGINTGDMVLGNMGNDAHQDYTVIGAAVNLASRLCDAADGGQILLTEGVMQSVLDELPDGWEQHEWTDPSPSAVGEARVRGEQTLPLPGRFAGRVVAIGPGVTEDPEQARYRFHYLYALRVKGVSEPVRVIRVETGTTVDNEDDSTRMLDDRRAEATTVERLFGKYRLTERLGAGGMGEVWRARDNFGNAAAIKMLRTPGQASSRQLRRFRQEAQIMARLVHRNVCRIYEIGEVDQMTYIAMELVEGVSLSRVLRSDLTPSDSRGIGSRGGGSRGSGDSSGSGPGGPRSDVAALGAIVSQLMQEEEPTDLSADDEAVEREPDEVALLPMQQSLALVARVAEAIQFVHEHGVFHRDIKPANIMIR